MEELRRFSGPAVPANAVSAAFAPAAKLRVQAHHDVEPAILVYDPCLGTIGLVEVIETDEDADELESLIERAAYLRQLALLEAAQSRPPRRALTVELVIVFTASCRAEGAQKAGAILRGIARDTGYLETIGVSLLQQGEDGTFTPSAVRSAFPWLLVETRRWYQSQKGSADGRSRWTLELDNYRQAGKRVYTMTDGACLHLVHGYNGTGKSSFTEALELLLTGRIDRLEAARQAVYFPVVRYRHANGVAATGETDVHVQLTVAGTPRVTVKISHRRRRRDSHTTTNRHGSPIQPPLRSERPDPFASISRRWTRSSGAATGNGRRCSCARSFRASGRCSRSSMPRRRRSTMRSRAWAPSPPDPSTPDSVPWETIRPALAWATKRPSQWDDATLKACPVGVRAAHAIAGANPVAFLRAFRRSLRTDQAPDRELQGSSASVQETRRGD